MTEAKTGKKKFTREFFVECGRRGGRKRMKMLSPAERRAHGAAAVRKREWRRVGDESKSLPSMTVTLQDRFWDTLDMGREMLPPR